MYRLEMHANAHVIDGVCSLSFSPRLSLSLLTELWARDARVCRGLVSGAGGPSTGGQGERDEKWQVYRHRSRQCESRLSGDKAGSTRARNEALSARRIITIENDATETPLFGCSRAWTRYVHAARRNQNRKRIPCRAAQEFIVDLGARTITVLYSSYTDLPVLFVTRVQFLCDSFFSRTTDIARCMNF